MKINGEEGRDSTKRLQRRVNVLAKLTQTVESEEEEEVD